jgi:hypothetical protein
MGNLKALLKKYLLIYKVRERLSPNVSIQQVALYNAYRRDKLNGYVPAIEETGFRVFSQFEEDGKLLFIFSLLGMTHKTFVEIGADDGVNSNCANLHFHFNWIGLYIDGNSKSIERGRRFYSRHPHPWGAKPKFQQAIVTAENINELISKNGLKGEIGLLSIDIDGNDYWVWKALTVVKPQVVIIETHIEFGMRDIVVPYDPSYVYPGKHPDYHGASPVAMVKLAKYKGYRLVGANELGFNLIFLREDLLTDVLPTKKLEEVLTHPSYFETLNKFEPIKNWEYLTEDFN